MKNKFEFQKDGYQEIINILGDTPIIVIVRDAGSNGLTGTWCTFEVMRPDYQS